MIRNAKLRRPSYFILPDGELKRKQIDMVAFVVARMARRLTYERFKTLLDSKFIFGRSYSAVITEKEHKALVKAGNPRAKRYTMQATSRDGIKFYVFTQFSWFKGYKGERKTGATQHMLKIFDQQGYKVKPIWEK